ncbi:hypothetical protein AFLA70_535g000672 [Aspergillus flavus AF70]|nr:hypothetical protein AFLA70_535g000672 [Aspergillus flavus AF70]
MFLDIFLRFYDPSVGRENKSDGTNYLNYTKSIYARSVDPTWNLPKLRKNTFRVFAGNSSTDLPLVLLKNAI